MSSVPIVLTPTLPSELLEYVLARQIYPTTLLICQNRASFLSSLSKAVKNTPPRAPSTGPDTPNFPADSHPTVPSDRHPLLIPTLHQIATSRHINLVFISTVTHLRAYLAVFPSTEKKEGPPKQETDRRGKGEEGLLVMYGVVGLHKDTSEWSTQGLGNSLAAVVESGSRSGRKVLIIEEKRDEDDDEVGGDIVDEDEAQRRRARGHKVWEEQVPMLNGNMKRAGLESDESGWSGRTVEVGRILARWCKFRRGDRDSGEIA